MVEDYNVICACSGCGRKFSISRLDLVAVHLGEYPTICDKCKQLKKAASYYGEKKG